MPADSGNNQDDREYDRDRDIDRGERPDRPGSKQKASAAAKAGTGKDLSHVPCKFFKVGGCTAGASCPFSHSNVEPGGQKETCTWFIKGNCKFGHKCALAHVLPGQSMAMDRKNKKAAQHAAAAGAGGGQGGSGGAGPGRSGGGRVKRDTSASNGATRLPLLAGGATAPTRDVNANPASGSSSSGGRPPMNMALKATISPSAPAPPLKDTDFFAPLEEQMEGLPSIASKTEAAGSEEGAAAVQKPSDEASPPSNADDQPAGAGGAPVLLPPSAPRPSTTSASAAAAADFGPIGSPPNYRSSQPISPTRGVGSNLTNGGAFSPGTSPRGHTHLNGINISSSPSTNNLNNNINNGINNNNNANASLLSSSPFSAPGTQSVFLSSSYSTNADPYAYSTTGGGGMAASLGSGLAMMGGGSRSRRWGDMDDMSMESGSPAGAAHSFSGLLSTQMQMSSSVNAQRSLNGFGSSRTGGAGNSGYDISIEYDEFGGASASASASRRREREEDVAVDDEDLEDFLPSSLNDLLTPEERSRRMSRSNSGQGPGAGVGGGVGGGQGAGVSYLTNALANATSIAESGSGNYNANGNGMGNGGNGNGVSGLSMGMGHRYSRSVPAPTLLGDIKSIWADASALPSSPPANIHRGTGTPSASYSASRFDSYLSQSQAQSSQAQSQSHSHYAGHDDGGFTTGGQGGLSMSMGSAGTASSLGMMSPSNASAAFLPGLQQNYLNAKAAKQQAQAQAQLGLAGGLGGGLGGIGRQLRGASNPLFSNSNSTASANTSNNNNSLASNYMQQPLGGLGLPSSASTSNPAGLGFQHTHTHTHGGTQTTYRTTPSPFDLTQGMHQHPQQQQASLYPHQLQQQQQQQLQQQQQYARPIPSSALGNTHHQNNFQLQDNQLTKDPHLGGPHLLSPSARALQQHAPGQSLPQGLAAGYSRIHALPPLQNVVGSPPAGVSGGVGAGGATSGFGGFGEGYADWTAGGAGSSQANANAPAGSGTTGGAGAGTGAGLETMFSRLSYSAATRGANSPGSGANTSSNTGVGAATATAGSGSGGPSAPPGLSRNVSGGRYASQQVSTAGGPLSPLSGPVVTRDDDDLFDMDK